MYPIPRISIDLESTEKDYLKETLYDTVGEFFSSEKDSRFLIVDSRIFSNTKKVLEALQELYTEFNSVRKVLNKELLEYVDFKDIGSISAEKIFLSDYTIASHGTEVYIYRAKELYRKNISAVRGYMFQDETDIATIPVKHTYVVLANHQYQKGAYNKGVLFGDFQWIQKAYFNDTDYLHTSDVVVISCKPIEDEMFKTYPKDKQDSLIYLRDTLDSLTPIRERKLPFLKSIKTEDIHKYSSDICIDTYRHSSGKGPKNVCVVHGNSEVARIIENICKNVPNAVSNSGWLLADIAFHETFNESFRLSADNIFIAKSSLENLVFKDVIRKELYNALLNAKENIFIVEDI